MYGKKISPSEPVSSLVSWIPVDATGGIESFITVRGITYKVHMFTSIETNYLTILDSGSDGIVEYLVVAGGGGGGMDMGGGGGGGGVLQGQYVVSPGQVITCTVGAGGHGGPGGSQYRTDGAGPQPGSHQFTIPATSGGNSVFGPFTAIGGGFGGSSYRSYTPGIAGGNGGSGGGSSGYNDNAGTFYGGTGTAGQGNRGGNSTAAYYSGGGGGAESQGVDSTAQPHGGQGRLNQILGYSLYWGGGGGGASYSLSNGGNGGLGGGGGGAVGTTTGGAGLNNGQGGLGGSPNAQTNVRGGNAAVNTGGGGGGGSHYNATNNGGEGGSGIVIVRYPISRPLPLHIKAGAVSALDAADQNSYTGSGTTWNNLTSTDFNATLTNGPTFSSANSGQIVFDGTNDYVACGNFGAWFTAGTIIFWMNSTAVENYRNPFHTHFQGVNTGIRFEQATGGSFGFLCGNDAGTYTGVNLTSSLAANTWYMVAATWNRDSSNLVGYLNGSQTSSVSNTYWPTQMPSVSLGNGFDSSRYFKGSISEFYLYNRQLSATEISDIFSRTRARYGV